MDAPLTSSPQEVRPSVDLPLTFEFSGAQGSWRGFALAQLGGSFLEWLKMTTDHVYLQSPLLGRSLRFYFLLSLVALLCLDTKAVFGRPVAEVVPPLGASWCCVAICLVLHCRGKPMLSDWMLCSIAVFKIVPPTEAFATAILCQSHPVQVAFAGGLVVMALHNDLDYCTGEGWYCLGRAGEYLLRIGWLALALTVHSLDYTSRVRFIVDGAVADWQLDATPERRSFCGCIWRWLLWSIHSSFLSSPIAGRVYRRLSTICALFPMWSMWVIFRYQQYTWDGERLKGSFPALLLLARDMGVAAVAILLPSALIRHLWHRMLLGGFIAPDLLLGTCVLVPWTLCVSQCSPLVSNAPNAQYNASLRTFYDTNMTSVGLGLSGIHPTVCLLVCAACVLVGLCYPELPDEWDFELHGPLLLYGFVYSASYFSRLVALEKAMTRTDGNRRASTAISCRSRSLSANHSVNHLEMEIKGPSRPAQLAATGGSEVGELEEEQSLNRSSKRSSDTEVLQWHRHHRLNDQRRGPSNAVRARDDTRDRALPARRLWHPSIAVIRHAERADKTFESSWPGSQDAERHPFDPPITEQGVQQAQEVALRLKGCGEFHLIVSSPYLRCVQTGLTIAERLDCALLIDGEVGEVFGPKVFGDVSFFEDSGPHARKPWRSLRHLRKAAGLSEPGDLKSADSHTFWCRALGSHPVWPEGLQKARLRYTRCFLKYMKRAWDTRRNIVVVTHQHMVQACLRVLPASSLLEVDRVPYCGGMVAQLHRSAPACLFPSETQQEDDLETDVRLQRQLSAPSLGQPLERAEKAPGPESPLHEARVQWWEVTLLGIDDVMQDSRLGSRYRALHKKYEEELGPRWQDVKRVLGGLPDTAMEEHPVGISFSNSSWSETRTLTPSEASTKIFHSLTRANWSQVLQQTNEKTRGKLSATGSECTVPISPALQQFQHEALHLPVRRSSDAPQDLPAVRKELVFTVTSPLARRRQATK